MKKRTVIFLLLFVAFSVSSPVFPGQDRNITAAAANAYDHFHYRKAMSYFRSALASGIKGDSASFVKYAIETMLGAKAFFYDLEKEEIEWRRKKGDKDFSRMLSEKHRAIASELMKQVFYLPIVEAHLKRAIKLDPDNIKAYLYLGNAYFASFQYADAVKNYEKAIRLTPNNMYAYKMAGDSYVAMGDYDNAKKFYADMIRSNESAVFKYDAAETEKVKSVMKALPETYKDINKLIRDGKTAEAEALLKNRISLNPSDYIALTELGSIYIEKGDKKTAQRLLEEAVKAAPDYPIAHLFLGRLDFLMRDFDGALEELNEFKVKMKLLPKMDKETKKMYVNDLYYLVDIQFTLKRYEDARSNLEEIIKMEPKEQDAHYGLGAYYYVYEHSRSKAYKSYMKTIEINPNSETAKSARYAIEYMRNNPDSRVEPDFSFINQEFRE